MTGSCHCGNLRVELETKRAPSDFPVRACQCTFCRRHGALSISDPQGRVTFHVGDERALVRYRFGLRTADFCICRGCGVYLAALTIDGRFGIINTHALVDRSLPLAAPLTMSYDGETATARTLRREQRWTPVRAAT